MSTETEAVVEKKENKLESPIKKQEPIETLKKSLKEEIATSVGNLKNQDEKVKEIERNAGLKDDQLVKEIKEEINLKETLERVNFEAERLKKSVFSELTAEKSIWNGVESVEEKIKKVEELFNNLDTEELQREDTETHARGWNATSNIYQLNSLKESIIGHISGKNKWSLSVIPKFRKLIHQKEFQDIIWISSGLNPDVLTSYESNARLNAFIQERPEYLESKEFRSVCLEYIKQGINNDYIFEGYKNNKDFKDKISGNNEIDFFKEKDDWNVVNLEMNISSNDSKIKTKRTEIPDGEEELIINNEIYKFDSTKIDLLSKEEKEDLQKVFLKRIKDYTIYNYNSYRIFGDEIISIGKKLGFTEEDLNKQIFDSILEGVLNRYPPTNGIEKEFPEVYEKIQETLLTPEKREDLLKVIYNNIRTSDKYFYSWKSSFDYVDLSKEELSEARESYLDFSSGSILKDKIKDIFGYSWSREEGFNFTKEERIKAFETMDSEQRSLIIDNYSGSLEKLSSLPFTNNDILEFAVNSIKSPRHAFLSDIEQAQKLIKENFPHIMIDNTDIVKRMTFKNLDSLKDINESLARNSVKMTPDEILSQFRSPEDFVLKQIKGADLNKLKALEEFKNNPDTPELPYLPKELFAEIKQHLLKKNYINDRQQLGEIISFVPRKYTFELWTDPGLQEVFNEYYVNALKINDKDLIHALGFLMPNTESINNAEQKVFDEYFQKQDYHNLVKYHEILFNCNRTSPLIKEIEELFKEKITRYGFKTGELILNHYTLEKTLKDISSQKLNQLNPNNLEDDKLIREWLNINYGDDSDKMFMVYSLIKNTKDFSYFNEKIKNLLSRISVSEKLIGTLQNSRENNPEDIDRAVELVNDLVKIFDDKLIEENYDYLYQTFSKLSPEEYLEKIHLLEETRPSLYSPLIKNINFDSLFNEVSSYDKEDQKKFFDLLDTQTYRIDSGNDLSWAKNTILYVNEVEEYGILHRDQKKKDKMVDLFSGDYKNTALREMTNEWKDFLKSDTNFLSPQIRIVSKIIDEAGGAGNMKHIESLGNLISQIQFTLDNKKTTNSTVQEIKGMLSLLEDRFSKEKWSQDDISEFYNLSKDILEAAPSLYSTLGPIFENISSSKDMKKFMSDIFPFYQTQLVIKQNISGDNITYNPRDLVEMRSSIKEFADKLIQDQAEKYNVFESEKLRLLEIAKDGFKNRFGLIKVPDNFTKENLRSIQNTIRYMGNISERTPERESLISLYLGLELDNKWGDFRGGKEINFSEYISEKQLKIVTPLLEEKQKSYELLSEISGITMDKMSKFQDLLQEEVSNNLIGDVQTIDVKLGNIKRNIDELIDPDIYQTQKEKDILSIFSTGGKNVNAVLSKLYGISTGKNIQLSEDDNKIKQKIESIFNIKDWTSDKVKEIQGEVQPIGFVTSMVNIMNEEKVEEKIIELQSVLIPNGQIIEIFNKLGEEFHQDSGALALSNDLSYLDNLIVKKANKITAEEKEVIKKYIESVRERMIEMENIFDRIKQYFEKIKKSSHLDNNPILKSRIVEIEKVIYSEETNSVITSQMTKDLNSIIENMRQCLGCMRKEQNNDTNLAFGDYNKFFLMNQSGKEKGSVADEIVFFIPITMPDGSREMSFVMDKVYGRQVVDMLIANICTVYKKYQVLKKEFPDSRLSISVTSFAMKNLGIDGNILEKKLRDVLDKKIGIEIFEELNAFIPKSSLSDNYVEFAKGSGARQSGERNFSGLVLR